MNSSTNAHWPSTSHTTLDDNMSVLCTMSQAPLSLVEFKTWPSSTTSSVHSTNGTNDSNNHNINANNFCGLMPIPSFAMRFFKDFQRFCPLLPDLVLQLDSGERVNVHRVLFYCCSAYCRQKLKSQQTPIEKDCWSSSRVNGPSLIHQQVLVSSKFHDFNSCSPDISVIRVPSVEYDSLRAVVDFVYSGGLIDRVNIECLPKIRFAATLLGIDELVTVCDSLFRLYQQGHRNNFETNHINQACSSTDITSHFTENIETFSCVPSQNEDDLCISPVIAENNSTSCTPMSNCSLPSHFKTANFLKEQQNRQRLPSVASVLAEISSDNRYRLIQSSTAISNESLYAHVNVKKEDEVPCSLLHRTQECTKKRCSCNSHRSLNKRSRTSTTGSDNEGSSKQSLLTNNSGQSIANISSSKFFCIIEYMKEDLVMTEKYIYASRLQNFSSLLSTYRVLQCIENSTKSKSNNNQSQKDIGFSSASCVQQKHRHSLLLFSLLPGDDNYPNHHLKGTEASSKKCDSGYSIGSPNGSITSTTSLSSALETQVHVDRNANSWKLQILSSSNDNIGSISAKGVQRFALMCHLDFSDKISLYSCCQHLLSNSIKEILHLDKDCSFNLRLDSVYCLKKSSGFKSSFRRERLLTTSECYKALAEYSRPEVGELPLVLLSCSGMLHIKE